jgi:hypothetical protein
MKMKREPQSANSSDIAEAQVPRGKRFLDGVEFSEKQYQIIVNYTPSGEPKDFTRDELRALLEGRS